uniref:Uncharacterized protein n=1 Tax=Arundo donax TaxID=35708 RepID=A0A0A9A680_ARUDO
MYHPRLLRKINFHRQLGNRSTFTPELSEFLQIHLDLVFFVVLILCHVGGLFCHIDKHMFIWNHGRCELKSCNVDCGAMSAQNQIIWQKPT